MSKPLLVIVASAPTMAELRRRRDAAALAGADLVELRLDSVADPDVSAALAGRASPVIVTCRPEWEGGAFKDSETERRRILECALQQGAEYVDVESKATFAADLIAATGGKRIVLSTHDFAGVPADLEGTRTRHARGRCRDRQGCRHGPLAFGQPSPAAARARREHRVDRHGSRRRAHAPAGRALPFSLVVRGRRIRSRANFGCAHAGRVQVPRDQRPDGDLRCRRIAADAFRVAVDAQCRVSRGRRRCGVRADGCVERRGFHDFRDRARRAGRQHHDSLQGRVVRTCRQSRRPEQKGRSRQHVSAGCAAMGGAQYRRQRISGAAQGAAGSARSTGGDSWRRRGGARCRGCARICWQRRDGVRQESRQGEGRCRARWRDCGGVPSGGE